MAVVDPVPVADPIPVEVPTHECPHCAEVAELKEKVSATEVAVAALAGAEATDADEEAAFWDELAGGLIEDATD